MFTVLLFLVLFVSLLLQFLNYLLPPPAQSPADSPNIQIPASPSNPKSEHEEVPADSPNIKIPASPSNPKSEHEEVPADSRNIQIPASPSNPKLEHVEVPVDSTNTQTVLSSLSALMKHDKIPAEASSSSGSTFDVFLSFRGEDTRHGFTDHLYYAMIQKGIIAFRDTEKLERGRPISSDLLKAIKESRIAVIILSANYATSTWCLEELAQIVECEKSTGLKVLPVFYHVEPSEVRKQTGSFYKAFCKHAKTFADDMGKAKVNKWREALTKVANISGWDLKGR
ncbi:putative TIR domain-containing protein [Rosa chinensis]|uniref:Putative TIR domain-containing protein n=2 Tax=Rosa chinensis TaxID=74649 RepID=A0A2P6PKW5_ROSCH|nr:putative TIR domain-containing protein [Rosa chinensis]